ncbi:MAG: cytochrome c1 [Gammaproteobacteria bacterium]|nr:cytochrome c1 [Gammaproteobacteria bacterium]
MDKLKTISQLVAIGALLAAAPGFAAGGGNEHMESADIDPGNIASLQRGARNFMNYCSGCHSAQYVRYTTIGKHLELSEEQLIDNLMFNADKTFETIKTSMTEKDASRWYGNAPPDLSLIARAKGVDYLYNFLKGFYIAENSPTGVDNLALAGTSMPHVLWELQGFQRANFSRHENDDGSVTTAFAGFETVTPGSLDAEQYDDFVRDTVNFLAYIAEPIRSDRQKLGVWVIMFLIFFLVLASMLKKQIWKDVK